MDNACGVHQNMPRSIPGRAKIHTAALSESLSQGTSIDLKSALALLLSRLNQIEPNIANATGTINLVMKE